MVQYCTAINSSPADYHSDLQEITGRFLLRGSLGRDGGVCNHLRETSMWREDDFEDKGRQVKAVPEDKRGELTNDSDREPEGKAERSDGRGKESSH
jgi:uncharacterized protein YjbJ (UPF0337 family)